MNMLNILDISAAGMDVQQARLEVAASNLANSSTTAAQNGSVYRPLTVVVRSSAPSYVAENGVAAAVDALPRPSVAAVTELNVAPRLVYDPGHPDADARGFVSQPGVDPIGSMLDLMSISRTYEANLRAFDITRSLLQRTMDMGNRQ